MKLDLQLVRQLQHFALEVDFSSCAPILALFGRSGSGKTTLINCLAGIISPDKGRIVVDGTTLFDSKAGINLPPEARRIGYIFQDALLFPHLNVERNLRYGLPRSEEPGSLKILPDEVIQLLGLENLLNRRPSTLSGGEKQRVAIGRALLSQPRLLLMDEPLASLDGERRHEILSYIELLRDQLGISIVFVSHSVSEVTRLADEMMLLSEGHILASGAVHEVMGRLDLYPHTGRHEAGAVIESQVLSHDEAYDLTNLAFDGGNIILPRIQASEGDRIRVRIRARDVSIATSRPSGFSIANIFEGTLVKLTEETGPMVEAQIRVGNAYLIARITRRSADVLHLVPDQKIFAMVKAASIDRRSIGQSA
jgi:molybdate transport system ATP-binding protein